MLKTVSKPFGGFATEALFSNVPMACNGPYAVRVRLVPADSNGKATPGANKDWGKTSAPVCGSRRCTGTCNCSPTSAKTDADRGRVDQLDQPYTTVARLTLPQQDTASTQGRTCEKAEASVFDPWQALAEHRPWAMCSGYAKWFISSAEKGRGAAS